MGDLALKLTVIGSAPSYSLRPGVASSCYLVEAGERALVLDFGQGAFAALAGHRAPDSVDALLVSHLHADHLVDLVPLRHFLQYDAQAGRAPVLHGPRDLRARFDAFQAEEDFLAVLPTHALEPGRFEVAGFAVEARHVTHIQDSFAFRVSLPGAERGLVYSGDCGKWEDLLPLIRPTDTLLCEAAWGASTSGGGIHLTAAQAGRAAAEGGAERLILTHVLDRHAGPAARGAAAEVFGGEVVLAEPQLAFTVANA